MSQNRLAPDRSLWFNFGMKKLALFLACAALAATSQNLFAMPKPAPVPETSTWIAGATILVPFGISTFRAIRHQRKISKTRKM
jgi:hypothetical protein